MILNHEALGIPQGRITKSMEKLLQGEEKRKILARNEFTKKYFINRVQITIHLISVPIS